VASEDVHSTSVQKIFRNVKKSPPRLLLMFPVLLFKCKVKKYQGNWFEHDLVLEKIESYENGKIWKRKEVVSE
jgi:hypothetical protein